MTDSGFSWAGQRWRVFFDAVRDFSEATGDFAKLYPTITRSLSHALHAACSLRVLSDDGQFLNPGATFDPNPELEALLRRTLGAAPIRVEEAPQLQAALHGEGVSVMEPIDWREFGVAARGQHQDRLHSFSPAAALLVPMRGPNGPLGLVAFLRRQEQRGATFLHEDQSFAQDLVDHATVAVVNAHGMSGRMPTARAPLGQPTPEVREALNELRQKDALATLAAGLAHDFDHLLSTIQVATNLQLDQLGPEDPDRARLEDLRSATEQASGIRRKLLYLSRQQLARPEILYLNDLLKPLKPDLQELVGPKVKLELEVEDGVGAVCLDRGHLMDAVSGLLMNAQASLPGRSGTVRISLRQGGSVEELAGIGLPVGKYAVLTVRDFGAERRGDQLARADEPFYSSNADDMGLGLAVASAFTEHCGGGVSLASEPGAGTGISLWLPVVRKPGQTEPGREPTMGQSVLLALASPSRGVLVRRALRAAGFHVLDARTGPRALEAARFFSHTIDLAILDAGHQQSGLERELLRARPHLKVLFYAPAGGVRPAGHHLEDPLNPRAVVATVRRVLSEVTPLTPRGLPPPAEQ